MGQGGAGGEGKGERGKGDWEKAQGVSFVWVGVSDGVGGFRLPFQSPKAA